jgi:hypothetical protein
LKQYEMKQVIIKVVRKQYLPGVILARLMGYSGSAV